jgi:hypothetical protein
MSAYTNHGKTTSTNRNIAGKSTSTERDHRRLRRAVSKEHRTTVAQVTVERNTHFEDPVSTKPVRLELHGSNIHLMAAIATPLVTESNAQMRNNGITIIKTEYQTAEIALVIWSDESSFTLFPMSGSFYGL